MFNLDLLMHLTIRHAIDSFWHFAAQSLHYLEKIGGYQQLQWSPYFRSGQFFTISNILYSDFRTQLYLLIDGLFSLHILIIFRVFSVIEWFKNFVLINFSYKHHECLPELNCLLQLDHLILFSDRAGVKWRLKS